MARKSKEQTEKELLAKFDRMWQEASDARKKWDYKWFVYGMWVRGYHYARYDKRSKMVVGTPPNDGRPQVSINRIYPTLRAVRNYALRNKPKAEVTPDTLTDDSLRGAQKATKFLDYIHERNKLRPKLKNTVFQALETSSSWWQVIWDGNEVQVNPVDVFDYYPDPKARAPREARYGILAVSRSIKKDLEKNKDYDQQVVAELTSDNRRSSSSYKEMLLNYDSNTAPGTDRGTVIVKEFWYEEDGKFYVAATAGGRLIRKPEEVDTILIPFFKLSADIMPFSMYGEGWVKNMIDPQKLLNSAVSSVAEYNVLMNKAKVITDKGAGVRIYNNQHGQIIEKKRGYNITPQPITPLNQAIFEQIQFASRFIEDIGAVHDATMGRVPTGARSGKAIEGLQMGDSNNMSELVENIEDFLEDVYEYILWLVSRKYQDLREIVVKDYTSNAEAMKVVGAESPVAQAMKEVPENTLVVSGDNMVDVKISSYLSFTPEAKRESVKELASLVPDLPPDVILDAYGVGNIADVVMKIKQKKAEDQQAQFDQQAALMDKQKSLENPESSGREAFAAIRTLISGGTPQVPTNPGRDYIGVIDNFLQKESDLGELDPKVLQAVQTFRDQIVQGAGVRQ